MKYRVDDNGYCLDDCKIYSTIKIGSGGCENCKFCIKRDTSKRTVTCELYQNREMNRNGANK